jgi:hypothetical protein
MASKNCISKLDVLLKKHHTLLKELEESKKQVELAKREISSPTQYERNVVKLFYTQLYLPMEKVREDVNRYPVMLFTSKCPDGIGMDANEFYRGVSITPIRKMESHDSILFKDNHFYLTDRFFSLGLFYEYHKFEHNGMFSDDQLYICTEWIETLCSQYRKHRAARTIQRYVRNHWFEQPTYKSGRVGFQARKGWEMAQETCM